MAYDIEEVLNEGPLKVRYLQGRSSTLVVSFSSVGSTRWEEPPLEFVGTGSMDGENHMLFITDISRSWLNAEGMLEKIMETIDQAAGLIDADRVVALGVSMGATMALHVSRYYRFDSVLALAPQYSVDPSVVPDEHRWQHFIKKIENFRFPKVEGLTPEKTKYYIVHGGHQKEQRHLLRFPKVRGIAHFVFPKFDHDVGQKLRTMGVLPDLVGYAINGRSPRFRKTVERLGGMFRSTYERKYQPDLPDEDSQVV